MAAQPTVRAPGRDKILGAAIDVFGERGYDAASIAEIAEQARVAKSVIYHHFGSKAELYTVILEVETEELIETVAAALPQPADGSFQPRLRAGIDAYLGFLEARPAVWRLLLREAPADQDLLEVYKRLQIRRATTLTALLSHSPSTGPRRSARKEIYTGLVATAIRAFATWWYDHRDVPRAAVVGAILTFASAFRVPDS